MKRDALERAESAESDESDASATSCEHLTKDLRTVLAKFATAIGVAREGAQIADGQREHPPASLGSVTLFPHQRDAAIALSKLIDLHGGALLADEPGMGKTFAALRVAARYAHPLVVAPASLFSMWHASAARAGLTLTFVSYDALSRRALATRNDFDLIILDESHHLRNPATRRYDSAARLVWGKRVLMLSATPIHNRRKDLLALFALFLGSASRGLSDHELARLVVRRRASDVDEPIPLPALRTLRWESIPQCREVLDAILDLPPPLPPLGGGTAHALVRLSLVRAWCSSDAALLVAVQRRLAAAAALEHALSSGRYPTRQELRSWGGDGESIQLAFSELLAAAGDTESAPLLACVALHATALRRLRQLVEGAQGRDEVRFERLVDVLGLHTAIPTLVFTHSRATAHAAYRALSHRFRCALLTGDSALIASGAIARAELLRRFGADSASDAVSRRKSSRRRHSIAGGRAAAESVSGATGEMDTLWSASMRAPPVEIHAIANRGVPDLELGSAPNDERARSSSSQVADAMRVDVLIATDVISEGVNLPSAGLVVHLDLPWTPARLEQRVGRARRLGSAHTEIVQIAIAPPVDADELRSVVRHLAQKGGIARRLVGDALPLGGALVSPAGHHEVAEGATDAIQSLQRLLRDLEAALRDAPSEPEQSADHADCADCTDRDVRHARDAHAALGVHDSHMPSEKFSIGVASDAVSSQTTSACAARYPALAPPTTAVAASSLASPPNDHVPHSHVPICAAISTRRDRWSAVALISRGAEHELVTLTDLSNIRAPGTFNFSLDPHAALRCLRDCIPTEAERTTATSSHSSRSASKSPERTRLHRDIGSRLTQSRDALASWCAARDAQDSALASVQARSTSHREILQRLAKIGATSRLDRVRVATLVARARSVVLQTSGVGGEGVLRQLQEAAPMPNEGFDAAHRWLGLLLRKLESKARRAPAWAPRRVEAILVLIPSLSHDG
ncbi:MAG: helicase-related protein [Gemmatimonadaceae bacterium]